MLLAYPINKDDWIFSLVDIKLWISNADNLFYVNIITLELFLIASSVTKNEFKVSANAFSLGWLS